MRFVPYSDRKAVAAALQADLHRRHRRRRRSRSWTRSPSSAWARSTRRRCATWRDAWERFIPFLEFPPEVRRVIYTTNAIESLNYQLRKIIKNRGHFPNDDAVIKLLWLAIRDIEDKRARATRQRNAASPRQTQGPGRLVEGQSSKAGKPPSAPSPSPTPTASPATSTNRQTGTAYTEILTSS